MESAPSRRPQYSQVASARVAVDGAAGMLIWRILQRGAAGLIAGDTSVEFALVHGQRRDRVTRVGAAAVFPRLAARVTVHVTGLVRTPFERSRIEVAVVDGQGVDAQVIARPAAVDP